MCGLDILQRAGGQVGPKQTAGRYSAVWFSWSTLVYLKISLHVYLKYTNTLTWGHNWGEHGERVDGVVASDLPRKSFVTSQDS